MTTHRKATKCPLGSAARKAKPYKQINLNDSTYGVVLNTPRAEVRVQAM